MEITDALAALLAGQWARAAMLLGPLAAETDDPRAHAGLAQAAWWLDDAETALGAREAAYRASRDRGDDLHAALQAATLGYDSMLFGAGVAVGRGWLTRAAELLEQHPDALEAGWLAVRQAEVALNVDHDAAAAALAAGRAQRIGRHRGDTTLVTVGQALGGLAQVRLGEVAAGMPLLDVAAVAATAGDVEDLMWTGKICCWLISACQETHDLERAGEWCLRVAEVCAQRDLAPLFAVCRTQYASVLLAGGRSQEAESTLLDVMERLERSRRSSRRDAVAQLGELRRRQGRLAEAEDLLRQAGFTATAVTSLARLRLDQGDPQRAWSTVSELLRSTPPDQLLDRVDALAVAVPAALASGRPADARRAADELRAVASRVGTTALLADADAAEGRLATGREAVERWQDAVRRFDEAGLAFAAAEARLDLAAALRLDGDALGARDQEESARAALAPLRGGGVTPLTPRQAEVLGLVAHGLSNADIAARLHLSEHTVHRHLSNIYTTLDLGSRAAAAAYAVGHGLA